MIERAYRSAEAMELAVWCQDEAGPFQTVPHAAHSWQEQEQPQKHPQEYIRNGTAKLMTLFHPHAGQVQVKGVESTTNVILHTWLKQELLEIVDALPQAAPLLSPE